MLAAGRSLRAATARRAATAGSNGAAFIAKSQRPSLAPIRSRTLSSGAAPGTVAGARAAASAGSFAFFCTVLCCGLLARFAFDALLRPESLPAAPSVFGGATEIEPSCT